MKIRLFTYFVIFLFTNKTLGQSVERQPNPYAQTIKANDLSEYLHVLASDSLEGRETGQPGQKRAADYLAGKFREFGVEPGMVNADGSKSYFQKFDLVRKQWDEVYLILNKKKRTFLKDFYAYGDLNIPEEVKSEVVFGGYGIETDNYSDYRKGGAPLKVKDKVVIIFPGEPIKDGKSLITGDSSYSSWANDWRKKVSLAKSKGAKLVLVVVGKNQKEFDQRLNQLKEHLGKPTLGFAYKERPSAFFISVDLAAEMLGTTSQVMMNHLETIPSSASNPKKQFTPLKPVKISFKCSVKESTINTENVLGFIEGTDKKDEVIVITAHYDHLGIEDGKICYGADDDGTGTSALLEIAQAFALAKKEGKGSRRSILIMPVTAEEKGLMGSEYYTDHPVYPLNKTVANLNIDMIGRIDKEHEGDSNYVYLIGTNLLSTELHTVSENANILFTQINLDYRFNSYNDPNRFYYRSDHYNFAKNNIPVIFYFNGVHDDYHKPTDTVDKILFPKAEKITRLVFYTAWELANMEEKIKVDVIKK
jgi:hypothetical protein